MTEELFMQLLQNAGIIGVLGAWLWDIKRSAEADKGYHREQIEACYTDVKSDIDELKELLIQHITSSK